MAVNLGAGIGGGLSGAGTGAFLGSFGGPIGTGIGAGVGGLSGLLGGLFGGGGSEAEKGQLSAFPPEVQEQITQMLPGLLSRLGGEGFSFDPIESEARRGFEQQTIPSIAERFTGMGGQRSSAFGQQLGAAGAGLESQLGAMKQQFGQQQQGSLLQLLSLLRGDPTYQPRTPGAFESMIGPLLQAGGQAAGAYFGGRR